MIEGTMKFYKPSSGFLASLFVVFGFVGAGILGENLPDWAVAVLVFTVMFPVFKLCDYYGK